MDTLDLRVDGCPIFWKLRTRVLGGDHRQITLPAGGRGWLAATKATKDKLVTMMVSVSGDKGHKR
jgi:hypothetical protein